MAMKTCVTCGCAKPLHEFQNRKDAKDGKRNNCRQCSITRVQAYYAENREAILKQKRRPETLASNIVSKRKMTTGFSPELFAATKTLQGNMCAICGQSFDDLPTKHVHADHCHETKTPRGVLCHGCNTAIGLLRDDTTLLANAIRYLSNPPAAQLTGMA